MDNPDKIVSEVGERRPRVIRLPALRPYLWDTRLATGLCRACRDGSITILTRSWRWVRAAAPGDRWIRALLPAGVLAGAVYALRTEPRAAAAGILVAWVTAAAVLAPRDAWSAPTHTPGEAPAGPAQLTDEQLTYLDRMTLLGILKRATARRNGVHFGELHQHLTAHPRFAALDRADVGALLEGFGVPWERSLSVDGVSGRTGVRRGAVEQLLQEVSPGLAVTDSRGAESAPDQHESQLLSDGSRGPLGAALGPP